MSEEKNTNELQERVEGFNEKLIPILKEFRLGLGGEAFITSDGRIAGKPTVFDDSKSYEKKEVDGEDQGESEPNDSGLKSA